MREPLAPNDGPMTNPEGVNSTRLAWSDQIQFTDADVVVVDSSAQKVPFVVSGSGSALMLISLKSTLLNDDYTITIGDSVQSIFGVPIDGNGDGIAGGDAVFSLRHRLRHDSDDDRDIDLIDFAALQAIYNGP